MIRSFLSLIVDLAIHIGFWFSSRDLRLTSCYAQLTFLNLSPGCGKHYFLSKTILYFNYQPWPTTTKNNQHLVAVAAAASQSLL